MQKEVASHVGNSCVMDSTNNDSAKHIENMNNQNNRGSTHNSNENKQSGGENPFKENEWDEGDEALVDTGEPGIPVIALYDYDGSGRGELSFKEGDTFEKLKDEDEQGWCKGRKEGRVGLYPANYVQNVK